MKNKVIIIAEAGVNHNGDFETAKKLILAAANAGADYVKFQTFNTDKLVSKDAIKAEYQKNNFKHGGNSQYDMLKKLEIPLKWYIKLVKYSKEKGIKFLSTGFDIDSIELLDALDIDFFKIPSGEITNKPFLEYIAKKRRPIIISTGMSNMKEIDDALEIFRKKISKDKITVLHCNTEYPTPMKDVNLLAMNTIKKKFNVQVGYSDHTLGIEVPIAAVALGAKLIEKHITLDKKMKGPDHLASITPNEFKVMVDSIRNIEKAISGKGVKRASQSEKKNIKIARKSIHIEKSLLKGQKITKNNIKIMRPGDGISPMRIDEFINKVVNKNLPSGHKLSFNDIFK